MALIPCPECGNEVSELAAVCPGCGYPFEQSPRPPGFGWTRKRGRPRPLKATEWAWKGLQILGCFLIVVGVLTEWLYRSYLEGSSGQRGPWIAIVGLIVYLCGRLGARWQKEKSGTGSALTGR
jgi:hypothetical protein